MGELIELLTKIVTGEKSRLFWAILIIVAILAVIVFPYIDANFLYYDRIEKRIDNLKNLVELTGKSLEENEALSKEYEGILEEIEIAREKALSNATKKEDSRHDRLVKFCSGAILWILLAMVMPFAKKKGEKRTVKQFLNNILAATFCLAIGTFAGYIFIFVPTLGSVEVNAILAPILQLIVLWLIIETPKREKLHNVSEVK